MAKQEAPYFIEKRGCLNCDASISMKKRTEHEYGFDHELMVACLLHGCFNWGHDLSNPYIDPTEIARMARENGSPEIIANARTYLLGLEKEFGKFYQELEIPINQIIESLENPLERETA